MNITDWKNWKKVTCSSLFLVSSWSEHITDKTGDQLASGSNITVSRAVRSRPSVESKHVCTPSTRGGQAQDPQNGDNYSFGDSTSPQHGSLMDSQPLTHSHFRIRLLLHLGIPNISLLSLCGCRGTYGRQIQSCWSRHKRGWTQMNKPGACGHYSHFLYPNAGKGGRPPSLLSCFTSFTLINFFPHKRPKIVALFSFVHLLLRRCWDCGLQQVLLWCTILLPWELSVWIISPGRSKINTEKLVKRSP